jgi:hypothetical protein
MVSRQINIINDLRFSIYDLKIGSLQLEIENINRALMLPITELGYER